jgi:hypothetical protein
MDLNDYAIEIIVRGRLADMRMDGERRQRLEAARPASRPVRDAVARRFIRMGARLLGVWKDTGAYAGIRPLKKES